MPLLPNLIIPGAPKSATTSLCEYLSQHQDVFIPKLKEPRYFIADKIKQLPKEDCLKESLFNTSILTFEEYKELYKEGVNTTYSCDASVQYLYYHNTVIPAIKKMLGDPSIIIVLRNPISRAFSNFSYVTPETARSFEDGLFLEQERINDGWNSFWFYKSQGFYYEQVKHFMSEFTKVKIILMEEFKAGTDHMLKSVFEFLNIEPMPVNTEVIHNRSGNPKNKLLEWFFFKDNLIKKSLRPVFTKLYGDTNRRRLSRSIKDRLLVTAAAEMNANTYNNLVNIYREDILKLQDLINKDLSPWIKTK